MASSTPSDLMQDQGYLCGEGAGGGGGWGGEAVVHVITLDGRQGPQGSLGKLNTHSRSPPKHTGEFKEHRDRGPQSWATEGEEKVVTGEQGLGGVF